MNICGAYEVEKLRRCSFRGGNAGAASFAGHGEVSACGRFTKLESWRSAVPFTHVDVAVGTTCAEASTSCSSQTEVLLFDGDSSSGRGNPVSDDIPQP